MHEHVYEEIDKQTKAVLLIMNKNTNLVIKLNWCYFGSSKTNNFEITQTWYLSKTKTTDTLDVIVISLPGGLLFYTCSNWNYN